jgi:cytochrome d ubiquinol oxidase subunit II
VTKAEAVLACMWVGVTLYALFGGADFGAGLWDLVAGRDERGDRQRHLIADTIGPVWEANHVWLIFVLVVLWTGFPAVFAQVMATLYVPLTAAAVGVILRGSTFAFRKSVTTFQLQRLFGATFALSSVITPFFLGAVAGAVASGRVPRSGSTRVDVTVWWNPTSVLGGVLAVTVCAYLAAVFLVHDAARRGDDELAELFRQRGIVTAVVAGLVALGGIVVLRADAEHLFDGLTGGRALPLLAMSGLAGMGSLALLLQRRAVLARIAAGLAVTAVVWGWAAGQYPFLLEDAVTIEDGAGSGATLTAMLVSLVIAGVLVLPPLAYLLAFAQRTPPAPDAHLPDA